MKFARWDKQDGSLCAYVIWCPGCRMLHQFDSRWTFDGNMDAPTFAPSLLVGPWWRMPHDWDSDTAPRNLDGTYVLSPDGVHMASAFEAQCHSFVRSGRIEFLRDCTHEFAGQTVDLPELPEWV